MHIVHTVGCITLRALRLREHHRIPWPLTLSVAGSMGHGLFRSRIQWSTPDGCRAAHTLPCQGRDSSPPVRATKLVRPRAPSIGSTTRHCCRVELPHACCSRPRSRSAPFSPEASQLRVTWSGPIRAIDATTIALLGQRRSGKNDSRRLLQPTYSTSTRATARLPRRRVLRSTSAQVEARLTPCLQLRSRFQRSPREPRGEERPTGGVLRCGGVINRSQRLKPDL